MSLTKMSLDIAGLIPLAAVDLDSNSATPKASLGAWGLYRDAFGMRIFKYVKNVHSGDLALGDVMVKVADVTFTAAELTTATRITTSGLTADAHGSKLIIVEGNDSVAGDPPEGETGVIVSNTATLVNVDPRLPFSVDDVADIDCRILTPGWHGIQGGAAAAARDVFGVVASVEGISEGNFGWVQMDGFCPQAKFTAAAVAVGANVVTGAAGTLATVGAATMEKVVGFAPGAIEATHPGKMPVWLTLLSARDVV